MHSYGGWDRGLNYIVNKPTFNIEPIRDMMEQFGYEVWFRQSSGTCTTTLEVGRWYSARIFQTSKEAITFALDDGSFFSIYPEDWLHESKAGFQWVFKKLDCRHCMCGQCLLSSHCHSVKCKECSGEIVARECPDGKFKGFEEGEGLWD